MVDKWDAEITSSNLSSDEFKLTWDILEQNDILLRGWLQPDRKIVSIDGTAELMAEFAIWHRDVIAKNELFYLFDEGLNIIIEINDTITANQIVNEINTH